MGIGGFTYLGFPSKLGIDFILGACLLFIYILLKGLRSDLAIMNRPLQVIEVFIVMIPW